MQLAGVLSGSTKPVDLIPYMNYVSIDTTSTVDGIYNYSLTHPCSAVAPCLKMHNGSVVVLANLSFGGTAANNAIIGLIDPDGQQTSSTTNGPGKMMEAYIYYNGRISSRGYLPVAAVSSDATRTADPFYEPPWFSW